MTTTDDRPPDDPAARLARDGWPLLGRDAELDQVVAALLAEVPTGVVVTGATGVGKTRLAREAERRLTAAGRQVRWATTSAQTQQLAFAALAPWFGEDWPSDVGAPLDVVRFVRRHLEDLGPAAPVLALDDAQLLDPASVVLVHQLLATGSARVLLTVRLGDVVSDTVTSLWKDGLAERVEVRVLDEAATGAVLEGALGAAVGSVCRHELWQRSGGNPLWLRELVLSELEDGRLVRAEEGVWSFGGPPQHRGHRRLDQLVGARLGEVDAAARRALEVVALAEPMPLDVAERAVDLGLLERLERVGLVWVEDGRIPLVVLRHPVYGEVLRQQLNPAQAAERWSALAAALDQVAAIRPVDARLRARWRLEAGGPVAPDLAAEAAKQALQQADPDLAERLARAGLEVLAADAHLDPTARQDLEDLLEIRLVEALGLLGRWLEVIERCDALDRRPLEPELRARLSLLQMWPRLFGGQVAEADHLLAEVEEGTAERPLADSARALRAAVALYAGDLDRCAERATAVLERPDLSILAHRWATWTLVNAETLRGHHDRARTVAQAELRRLDTDASLALAPYEMMLGYCLALLRSGRVDEGLAVAERYHRSTLQLAVPVLPPIAALLVGMAQLERGDAAAAVRALREATAGMAAIDPLRLLPLAHSEMARALATTGDARGAAAALEAAEAAGSAFAVFAALTDRARVWQLAAAGQVAGARDAALAAAEQAGRSGQRGDQMLLAHDAVRLGGAKVVAPVLERLAPTVDGELAAAAAAHAQALVDALPGALERVAERFVALGALLYGAEAYAEAATVYGQRGQARHQQAASVHAATLLGACGGADTPALALRTERVRLTARELEMARLAADGLSSRQIAERCVVSVRTVESHLLHAFAKLGISERSQLAGALERAQGPGGTPTR